MKLHGINADINLEPGKGTHCLHQVKGEHTICMIRKKMESSVNRKTKGGIEKLKETQYKKREGGHQKRE